MRVVDVALFYGERSGGIKTYLDAKRRWATGRGDLEHHVAVPGRRRLHADGVHELPSVRVLSANGYRAPLGGRELQDLLRAIAPDVVLLHDPYWAPVGTTEAVHALGARVVGVHHASSALNAAAMPGPDGLWRSPIALWMRRAYREADAVMSAADPMPDLGRAAAIPLRFGLRPAFRPRPDVTRGDEVVCVGRLGTDKGVLELVRAAARSAEPWPLVLVGSGPARARVERLAQRLSIAGRLRVRPYVRDAEQLSRVYASARAVVMPGPHETFGLVGLEAAASGARTVCCTTAPSARIIGDIGHAYPPGDVDGLLAAIEAARAAEPDHGAAVGLGERLTWHGAFDAELEALHALVGRGTSPAVVPVGETNRGRLAAASG